MIYSIPYVLLVVFYGIIAALYVINIDEKAKRDYDILCIFVFVSFLGLRGFIGDDWTIYYVYFQKCSLDKLSLNLFQIGDEFTYEPGFTILVLLCKTLFSNYATLNMVCCLINVWLLYTFLRRYVKNVPLGFMIYMCMGGFIMSINLLRNTIAILIMANALHYITERKPIQYFGMCLIALSFHMSSLIYFPLYFFFNRVLNKWIFLAFFLVGIIFFLSGIKIVTPIVTYIAGILGERMQLLVENYTEILDSSRGISIGFLERVMSGTLVFCYYKKLCSLHSDAPLFINSFTLYSFFYFYFCEFDVMSSRLANLFVFSYWVLWPFLISVFSIKNNRRLFLSFLTIYSILKMIGTCSLPTYKYDNVLFGAENYFERLYIHDKYSDD